MASVRNALFRLSVSPDPRGFRVLLSHGRAEGQSVVNVMPADADSLGHFRSEWRETLTVLQASCCHRLSTRSGKRRHRQIAVDKALDGLTQIGEEYLAALFGPSLDAARRLAAERFDAYALRPTGPPLVEVDGPLDFFPLEFLPLLDPQPWWPRTPADRLPDQLTRRLQKFLGWSAVVCRLVASTSSIRGTVLENDPEFHLKVFQHRGLPGARREVSFFRARTGALNLRGSPWPRRAQARGFDKSFAAYVSDSYLRCDGSPCAEPDHLHHYACHCADEDAGGAHFILSHAGAAEQKKVVLSGLQKRCRTLERTRPARDALSAPLVFMNACGTSVIPACGVNSFPEFFVGQRRSRGFIGTETTVPDDVATAFSKRFYRYFFGGYDLGEALYRSRWELWETYRSPLGLLYTAYASPDIRVRNPRRPTAGEAPAGTS